MRPTEGYKHPFNHESFKQSPLLTREIKGVTFSLLQEKKEKRSDQAQVR